MLSSPGPRSKKFGRIVPEVTEEVRVVLIKKAYAYNDLSEIAVDGYLPLLQISYF